MKINIRNRETLKEFLNFASYDDYLYDNAIFNNENKDNGITIGYYCSKIPERIRNATPFTKDIGFKLSVSMYTIGTERLGKYKYYYNANKGE